MADTFRAGQVECCDLVGSEVDAVLTVFAVWPDRHALSTEGARHVPQPAFEADVVLGHRDGAHDLVLVIFDLREAVRHGARARPIPARRHLLTKRLMRPLKIVDRAPSVECLLRLSEIMEAVECEDLRFERAVETLVLAAALRV